ncbi:uncharacterized protein E0L32_000749 [Thyridium curvatum]|uniref:Zn(2)-C6 fungal-type domain-containing protein n=1 Tax=Thyridium curvatum TaxID=1093900 RepID=A0A507ARD6_9PEZI|nr:uncharacterized protein E0L32_000749 [Thyridium curvatum]TPX12572.1 hypothetical protein E0L32_000749 [Thyridium curvatum]
MPHRGVLHHLYGKRSVVPAPNFEPSRKKGVSKMTDGDAATRCKGLGQAPANQPQPRTGRRAKVKSGCRTCKIRKVKCDEGRPACNRCISTGRTCDGYGVWGGGSPALQNHGLPKSRLGSNALAVAETRASGIVVRRDLSSSPLIVSDSEQACFEWFARRTTTKMPGLFVAEIWKSLIFQASTTEPAVLHSVLAFSSHHQKAAKKGLNLGRVSQDLDEQEQFMLRQYTTAIVHLQSVLSRSDHSSTQIALVACAMLTCLEMLRGHFQAAESHFRNGLGLLRQGAAPYSTVGDNGARTLSPCDRAASGTIAQLFHRLQVQVGLLGNRHVAFPAINLPQLEPGPPITGFRDLNHARDHLDNLLKRVQLLAVRCRNRATNKQPTHAPELLVEKQDIDTGLSCWIGSLQVSKLDSSPRSLFAVGLLRLMHTMARIMLRASLWPDDESIYDTHFDDFLSIIVNAVEVRSHIREFETIEHKMDKSHSTVDLGWLPLLYFVATKCRHHRLRLQAVKLLDTSLHREGIWDSRVAAIVAKKVMEIEEGDFYPAEVYILDDFDAVSLPQEWNLTLPVLPESRRIHDLDIELPEDPLGQVAISGKIRREDGREEAFIKTYNFARQWWIDGPAKGASETPV